jgi:hypothetical protein
MDILPGAHANVLIYLISFIQEIFDWPVFLQNPETKRRIGISILVYKLWLIRSESICKGINPKSYAATARRIAAEGNIGGEIVGTLNLHSMGVDWRESRRIVICIVDCLYGFVYIFLISGPAGGAKPRVAFL